MQKTLIFIHVPKCGGTSLQAIFRRQFTQNRLIEIGTSPGKIREPSFRRQCSRGAVDCDALSGHIPYGMDSIMQRDVRYMTMLREPVQRYVSQYSDVLLKGWRCMRDHLRTNEIDQKLFNRVRRTGDLDVFLSSPLGQAFGNMQTRYLAGVDGDVEVTNQVLEAAMGHLNQISCIGLTERFDESLLLMAQCFGWRDIYYERINTSSTKHRADITQEQKRIIKNFNQYDLKLYANACELFSKQLQQYKGDMEDDLDRFKEENRTYKSKDSVASVRERLFKMWMKLSGVVAAQT